MEKETLLKVYFFVCLCLCVFFVYRMEFDKTKWSCPWGIPGGGGGPGDLGGGGLAGGGVEVQGVVGSRR